MTTNLSELSDAELANLQWSLSDKAFSVQESQVPTMSDDEWDASNDEIDRLNERSFEVHREQIRRAAAKSNRQKFAAISAVDSERWDAT